MLRVPPLVVTPISSVPGPAARRADSMTVPVSELFGLPTRIFTPVVLPFLPQIFTTPRLPPQPPPPPPTGGRGGGLKVHLLLRRGRDGCRRRRRWRPGRGPAR